MPNTLGTQTGLPLTPMKDHTRPLAVSPTGLGDTLAGSQFHRLPLVTGKQTLNYDTGGCLT